MPSPELSGAESPRVTGSTGYLDGTGGADLLVMQLCPQTRGLQALVYAHVSPRPFSVRPLQAPPGP